MNKIRYEKSMQELRESERRIAEKTTQDELNRLKRNVEEYDKNRRKWEKSGQTKEDLQEKYEIAKYTCEHLQIRDIETIYYIRKLPGNFSLNIHTIVKRIFEGYRELRNLQPPKPTEEQE